MHALRVAEDSGQPSNLALRNLSVFKVNPRNPKTGVAILLPGQKAVVFKSELGMQARVVKGGVGGQVSPP